jgi:hypothetical protein
MPGIGSSRTTNTQAPPTQRLGLRAASWHAAAWWARANVVQNYTSNTFAAQWSQKDFPLCVISIAQLSRVMFYPSLAPSERL